MKIKEYLATLKKKGHPVGRSPNWKAVQKLLEQRPHRPKEISEILGWTYSKTTSVIHRMYRADFIERADFLERNGWVVKRN